MRNKQYSLSSSSVYFDQDESEQESKGSARNANRSIDTDPYETNPALTSTSSSSLGKNDDAGDGATDNKHVGENIATNEANSASSSTSLLSEDGTKFSKQESSSDATSTSDSSGAILDAALSKPMLSSSEQVQQKPAVTSHHSTLQQLLGNGSGGTESPTHNNKNAFTEFLAVFFRKAESYEAVLKQRQDEEALILQKAIDKGSDVSLPNISPPTDGSAKEISEEGIILGRHRKKNSDKIVVDSGGIELNPKNMPTSPVSPELSPAMQALAAVEAISNFRSFNAVKLELKDSFDKSEEHRSLLRETVNPRREKSATSSHNTDDLANSDPEWKDSRFVAGAAAVSMEKCRLDWKAFCSDKKKDEFNEIAIESILLPLTVDEFYELVLKDNAPHSIGKFMSNIGDTNVVTTLWEQASPVSSPENLHSSQKRIIEYVHPVNAPMAPPTAKARKSQYLHKFGSLGLCLETCTVVEDVPMADCFEVEDRMWVYENADSSEKNAIRGSYGCTVAVTFHIRFVKSTMFRRIIENTTREEFFKWWGRFGDLIELLGPLNNAEKERLVDGVPNLPGDEYEQLREEVTTPTTKESFQPLSWNTSRGNRQSVTGRNIKLKRKKSNAINLQSASKPVFKISGFLRKVFRIEDRNMAVIYLIVLLVSTLNVMSLLQLMAMNAFLSNLDDRLDKMEQNSEKFLILVKDGVCAN